METISIRKSKKYPKFIKEHSVFKKFKTIPNGFKDIINNFNMPYVYNEKINVKDIKNNLLVDIDDLKGDEIISENQYKKLKNEIQNIHLVNNKVIINNNIINVLLKINKTLLDNDCNPLYLNQLQLLKNKNNLNIIFSTKAWDIATMLCGVLNLVNLGMEAIKKNLVGSIADPYCGIIYLTDNKKTKYGKSMLGRCVVRLIYDTEDLKPAIFLERVYRMHDNDYGPYGGFYEYIFKNAIAKHLKQKNIEIISNENNSDLFFINETKYTKCLSKSLLSYRDSDMPYDKKENYEYNDDKDESWA